MTTIYLIRHAEAEGNLYRRIHGWYDSLITDNGFAQIKALEDTGNTGGYMTWNAASSIQKYRSLMPAFK